MGMIELGVHQIMIMVNRGIRRIVVMDFRRIIKIMVMAASRVISRVSAEGSIEINDAGTIPDFHRMNQNSTGNIRAAVAIKRNYPVHNVGVNLSAGKKRGLSTL